MTVSPVPFSDIPQPHGSTDVHPNDDGSITIRTAPEQWAYAVSYFRADQEPLRGGLVVQVHLQVTAGSIGVGCLNDSGTTFLDEVFVAPAAAAATVELHLLESEPIGELVLRNASPDGPSEARVLGIATIVVENDDAARQPPLSAPQPIPRWSRYYSTAGETSVERLRTRRFEMLESPIAIVWTDGTRLDIRPRDQLSRAVYISGTYEPNTLAILKILTPPGGVFVDVGANAGAISIAAAAWVGRSGRVFSFEPSEREFERLTETVRSNQLERVTAIRLALSDRDGDVVLQVAADGFAGLNTTGDAFAYPGVSAERVETVRATTLDSFVAEHATRVDVIKIDVEGAEGAVLSGATDVLRSHRPAIVVEVFSRSLETSGWTRERLGDVLAAADYRLFAIDDATAGLVPLRSLNDIDEQNVVALPTERVDSVLTAVATAGYRRG